MTQLQTVQFDQFQFDPADGSLRNLNTQEQTTLRPQVASLLSSLCDPIGRVVGRDEICLAIWGEGAVVDFESGLAAIVKELRKSFEGLGGSAKMLETIPRRGYRLNVEATPESSDAKPHRRWYWIGLALLVLLLMIVFFSSLSFNPSSGSSSRSLVILPFERYGDLHQAPEHVEYLIADTLLARLWQADLPGLELIGRTSVQAYADRPSIAAAVADELGASLLLEGDLVTEANGWRVEARLLELPSGHVVWSESVRIIDEQSSVDPIANQLIEKLTLAWPRLSHSS